MAEGRMNLAALQQRDPYISEIVDTASQVALYSFNAKSNEWEKTSIEGSLFIYKSLPERRSLTRSASPLNGFMILNRLGLNNLIEPITKDVEFQQQDPFLLYRNSKCIYGVWFYDKDECKRLGNSLNRYVQDIIDDQLRKSGVSPSVVARTSKREGQSNPITMATMPQSQVDIMQMLSKAQQEYDTGSTGVPGPKKKTEPKPMIDNPNASAITRSANIIRPQPLKMPDSDTPVTGGEETKTPSTAPISLDALFRTASLQQGNTGGPKFPSPDVINKPTNIQRSVSMTTSGNHSNLDYKPTLEPKHLSEGDELPPLLKHIMSTGSMVEDIERQQADSQGPRSGAPPQGPPVNFMCGEERRVPDFTQPPPNHPAYRGPSPQTQGARKSPRNTTDVQSRSHSEGVKPKNKTKKDKKGIYGASSGSASVPGPGPAPQIYSGNLLPQFVSSIASSVASSQPASLMSQSTSVIKSSTDSLLTRRSPHAEGVDYSNKVKVDPLSFIKSGPLLTPADMLPSFSTSTPTLSSTSSTTSSHGTSYTDKLINPNLAAAAASLKTELLSPMAFTTSTSRRTPPAPEKPSVEDRQRDTRDTDSLPIAALTKEQLQQALLHLVKNDSSFISTIHEAYLRSLHELAGGKT